VGGKFLPLNAVQFWAAWHHRRQL